MTKRTVFGSIASAIITTAEAVEMTAQTFKNIAEYGEVQSRTWVEEAKLDLAAVKLPPAEEETKS